MRRWRGMLLAGLLGVSLGAQAQPELDRLKALVEKGRMAAAYQWAMEHREALEGRTGFDFYYGVAAIDTGHVAEGVFALERVLMRRPGLDRARLELARGYFLLGEDQRAEEEFRTVLAHEPPEAVVATVERFLEAIRRRADRYDTVLTAFAELGAGYDTNVNSATEAQEIDTEIFASPISLDRGSRAQEDAFGYAALGASLKHPLTPSQGVFAGFNARKRGNTEENDFDTGRVGGHMGWEWRGMATRLRVSGRAQRFFLDTRPYQDSYGGSAELRYSLADTTAATGFARFSRLNYRDQPIRDSRFWTAGLGLSHLWLGAFQPALSLTLLGGQEVADDDSDAARAIAERDLFGGQLGLRFVLSPDWSLNLTGQVRRSDYAAEHNLFGKTRAETYYQAETGLDWRFARHWSAGPRVRYSRNDANIAIYDYERTQAWLRLRYDYF